MASVPVWQPAQAVQYLLLVAARVAPSFLHKGSYPIPVLAKSARLTESADFARATKSGLRFSTQNFVGYLYPTNLDQPARAGLIISKNVGGSVTRHRIARKARHALRDVYSQLPTGGLLVVRALNSANEADTAQEITKIVGQLLKKLSEKANQK
jgi:ribonuclease P protein component